MTEPTQEPPTIEVNAHPADNLELAAINIAQATQHPDEPMEQLVYLLAALAQTSLDTAQSLRDIRENTNWIRVGSRPQPEG